jgi:thymidylate kinase
MAIAVQESKVANITETLLSTFFEVLHTANLPFVILRNYEHLPKQIGNDLDILIDDLDRVNVEARLRKAAEDHSFKWVNRAEFSPISLFAVHRETDLQLHFDLFTSLKWRGFDILMPRNILQLRQKRGDLFILHPVYEAALNLLTRLLYHGYIKEKYKPGILKAFSGNPEMAKVVLAEPFGMQTAKELVELVLAEHWTSIESATARLRRLLIFRRLRNTPVRVLTSIVADIKRLFQRFIVPPGLMIVMLGPDGSGKSTIAETVMDKLSPTFEKEKSRYFHWKPSVFRSRASSSAPVTNPHEKPTRNLFVSTLYLLYHWLDFILGSQLLLRPILFRNSLVVVDRYFLDLFVDPKRYRLNLPNWLLKTAYRFIMKPDLVIVLEAPSEVLQQRKQEVPLDETERQRKAYLDLAKQLPNSHVIDASQALEQVVTDVKNIALTYLAERTQKRLGIP